MSKVKSSTVGGGGFQHLLRHSNVDWLFRSKRGGTSEASNCFNYSFLREQCISAHKRDGKGNCFNYAFRFSECNAELEKI